jgi:Mrp family chromosome partitioning ATPase
LGGKTLGDSVMVDLTSEMAQLWASLGPASPDHARVIQFAGATAGEGTSTIAREFARFAAGRAARPVWLVDLDLAGASQHRTIGAEARRYGALGRPSAGSPDGSAFFTVRPPAEGPDGQVWADARFLVAYPVGGGRLWVTRFRREAMAPGQQARIQPSGAYWKALRPHAELIVVDAPAEDGAQAAVAVAPFVDFTVLVVAAGQGEAAAPAALKAAIVKAGGRCAGVVLNRAHAEPPSFLRALLR